MGTLWPAASCYQGLQSPLALTVAYAAFRDWRRSIAFAVTLEEWKRQETLHCILGMFGSPSNLNCLTQVDL